MNGDKEIEKKASIDREMSRHDNCDIIIKKRDGSIVSYIVKEIVPEIRIEFGLLYTEE